MKRDPDVSVTFVFVEVMDAHLQNNQTAEDDILTSPDRLKGRAHTCLGDVAFNDFTSFRKFQTLKLFLNFI